MGKIVTHRIIRKVNTKRGKQMSEDQHEQELREIVELKVSQLLESAKKRLQTYQNMQSISDTKIVAQNEKVDALERLETQIKAIKTENMHLIPLNSNLIGLKDYLGNKSKYLNAVYTNAINIRDNSEDFDESNASSPEGEKGKIQAMEEVIGYIKKVKVPK